LISHPLTVRIDSYLLNRQVHVKNPIARACRQTLLFHILREDPELYVDGKRMKLDPQFLQIYRQHWLPFASAWFDEACLKGAPAVRLRPADPALGLEDPVPQIVDDQDLYTYTTYTDLSTDKQGFRVLRNISRTTGRQVNSPKPDPLIFVMSGYVEADPDKTGDLTTPLASLQTQEGFMRVVQQCAASAESIRCSPFVFTEVTPQSAGQTRDASTFKSFYANHDTRELREQDAYWINELQAKQVAANQKMFDDFWQQYASTETRTASDNGDPYARQQAAQEAAVRLQAGMRAAFSVAVRPLPVNHHMVQAPQPAPRTDLVALQELSQEVICAIYGVPRRQLLGEISKTATGATISSEGFMQTVRMWRQRFSRVFTYIYRAVYSQADAAFLFQRGMLKPETRLKDPDFLLPDVITTDLPTLTQLYAMQLVDYAQYKEAALRLHHLYPPGGVDPDLQDPWASEQRISLIQQQSAKLGLDQTGIVRKSHAPLHSVRRLTTFIQGGNFDFWGANAKRAAGRGTRTRRIRLTAYSSFFVKTAWDREEREAKERKAKKQKK
jgi:hypothetical protein